LTPYLKGVMVILPGLFFLALSGCGAAKGGAVSPGPPPRSNVRMVERAFREALGEMELTGGRPGEVLCVVDGGHEAADLLRTVVVEELVGCGFTVVEGGKPVPELRCRVDTLSVTLSVDRSGNGSGRILRRCIAGIRAVYVDVDGSRRVYRAAGTVEDTFDSRYLDCVMDGEGYIVDNIGRRRFTTRFKPLAVGVVMTVFAWMLYSYRG